MAKKLKKLKTAKKVVKKAKAPHAHHGGSAQDEGGVAGGPAAAR